MSAAFASRYFFPRAAVFIAALFTGLICAAFTFAFGTVSILPLSSSTGFLDALAAALVFAVLFGGLQALLATTVSMFLTGSSKFGILFNLLLSGGTALLVGVAFFHSWLGEPSRDLAWAMFNNATLFGTWNGVLGVVCSASAQFLSKRYL